MDEPQVDTTEDLHLHLCDGCGQTWVHADESCVGPRFRNMTGPHYDCPMCVDDWTNPGCSDDGL